MSQNHNNKLFLFSDPKTPGIWSRRGAVVTKPSLFTIPRKTENFNESKSCTVTQVWGVVRKWRHMLLDMFILFLDLIRDQRWRPLPVKFFSSLVQAGFVRKWCHIYFENFTP